MNVTIEPQPDPVKKYPRSGWYGFVNGERALVWFTKDGLVTYGIPYHKGYSLQCLVSEFVLSIEAIWWEGHIPNDDERLDLELKQFTEMAEDSWFGSVLDYIYHGTEL